jgi:hypothetical protein
MTRTMLAALGLGAAVMLSAGAASAQGAPPAKNDYAKPDTWLCRPDKTNDNYCNVDLSTTVVKGNGSETTEAYKADPKAPIDCFYVYPTVSNDPGAISGMTPTSAEINVVKAQFARLGSKCRLYAPMYRQVTLTALRARMSGKPMPGANDPATRQTGYEDIVNAWNYYLAHDNHGRGVVLVGHSQGSGVLTQLIVKEIDGKPVEKKVISAILMGTRLPIDDGKETGLFKDFPLCASPSQTQCAIAYSSFRDTIPPPANSLFGKAPSPGQFAACANPAALGGGKANLHAYLSNGEQIVNSGTQSTWVKGKLNPTTPFVSVPGLLTGECVKKNGFSYLEVHVNAVPSDPRTDTVAGDVVQNGQVNAAWGLHLIDANLEMGNIVDVVGQEAKAYLAKAKK